MKGYCFYLQQFFFILAKVIGVNLKRRITSARD
jgi:hypothetical protein